MTGAQEQQKLDKNAKEIHKNLGIAILKDVDKLVQKHRK